MAINMTIFTQFINGIKPLLTQSQILGITALRVTEKNINTSKKSCIFIILSTIFLTSWTLYTIYRIRFILSLGTLVTVTEVLCNLVRFLSIATIWICGLLKTQHLKKILQEMIKFDQNLGIAIDYKTRRKRDLKQMIIRNVFTLFISLIFVVVRILISKNEPQSELIRTLANVVKSQLCHQTTQLVLMIKLRFCLLNTQIRKIVAKKTKEELIVLYKICDLHHRLCKMIETFNDAFGVPLLFVFALSFLTLVVSSFYTAASILSGANDPRTIVLASAVALFYISDVVYVCSCCNAAALEAERTKKLIHKIKTEDKNVIDEIEMFSLQISNSHIGFSAADFFRIDNGLIFPIIGGATTYLIILIQLFS